MKIRNLGYACENYQLRNQDEIIRTSRTMRKRTFKTRGMKYVNELCEANLQDLLKILKWNHENGVKLFRISSDILPWKSHWRWDQLPDNSKVLNLLSDVGGYARLSGQRLTFHPDHFVKLASPDKKVAQNSIDDLIEHDNILNAMFGTTITQNHYNTVNIHIGAAYGNKFRTLDRFLLRFRNELPSTLRCRLTIENDDKPALYHTRELFNYFVGREVIPIMFDFHHYRVNPDPKASEKYSAKLAELTWPVLSTIPIFHWSESRRKEQGDDKIRKNAHSDLCYGPLPTYKLDRPVDLMIEAKHKEQSINLIKYANGRKVHSTPKRVPH